MWYNYIGQSRFLTSKSNWLLRATDSKLAKLEIAQDRTSARGERNGAMQLNSARAENRRMPCPTTKARKGERFNGFS
jgi:hypothetical protein